MDLTFIGLIWDMILFLKRFFIKETVGCFDSSYGNMQKITDQHVSGFHVTLRTMSKKWQSFWAMRSQNCHHPRKMQRFGTMRPLVATICANIKMGNQPLVERRLNLNLLPGCCQSWPFLMLELYRIVLSYAQTVWGFCILLGASSNFWVILGQTPWFPNT